MTAQEKYDWYSYAISDTYKKRLEAIEKEAIAMQNPHCLGAQWDFVRKSLEVSKQKYIDLIRTY